ncbi:hypothetical protein [Paenibacillus maysiensis]|uniref:hypothetical protein n=1 Tax=Paenibacillus maysiensis TaxID=1155954 RepID=UPI00046EEAE1|nr:hypothetical protein [Paenibacillus maysiensis]
MISEFTDEEINERIKVNMYNEILELEFSPWMTNNEGLPDKEGVIVAYNPVLKKYIPSYTNNIPRRYDELLKEKNTKDMSRFCFAIVDDYTSRKHYRELLKTMFLLDNWKD